MSANMDTTQVQNDKVEQVMQIEKDGVEQAGQTKNTESIENIESATEDVAESATSTASAENTTSTVIAENVMSVANASNAASTENRDKAITGQVDSALKGLSKNWLLAKKAKNAWDIQTLEKVLGGYNRQLEEMSVLWANCQNIVEDEVSGMYGHLKSEAYVRELEDALKAANIPLQGQFPQYEFPPFKLMLSIDMCEARLSLGRKQEKTTIMQAKELSKWVALRYQKIIGKKFDANRFMKELLAAYKYANRSAYREKDVLWGRAVSLDTIYELLTMRRSGRQEYPKQLYAYDLGCLKEQFDMVIDDYKFELGFARNQSKAVLIVDSHGRESRVSSLTVYKNEDKDER